MKTKYNDILEESVKKYLDTFFKGYKYSISIKLKKYKKEGNVDIDKIILLPCERLLINKNIDDITEEIMEQLNNVCVKQKFETHEEIKKIIFEKNNCKEKKCYSEKTCHVPTDGIKGGITTYQKVNGHDLMYYEISFMENTTFSEEMLNFYKYFISKTLEMIQFDDNLEIDKNIFIDSVEEYKSFITKAFLSQCLDKEFRFENSYQIIESITQALKLNYEKAYTSGNIIISDDSSLKDKLNIKFKVPIELKEIKKIRKILEVSKEKEKKLYLYLGEDGVEGLAKENKLENSIELIIKNSQSYDFVINRKDNLKKTYFVKNGNISFGIPNEPSYFAKCKNHLKISKTQSKGTIVVILEAKIAKLEVSRLSKTGIGIDKFKLEEEHTLNMTSIDGAMIIDTEGNCHGIGIILDSGEGILNGDNINFDSSRGARFNSASKYHNYLKTKTWTHYILIVSEDGDMDYFEYIDNSTEAFEKIKQDITNMFNQKEYGKVIEIFKEKQEYINEIKVRKQKELNKKLGETYSLVGYSYTMAKDYRKGMEIYKMAIEVGVETPTIYNNIGASYTNLGEKNDAIPYFIKCIEVNKLSNTSLGEIILKNISDSILDLEVTDEKKKALSNEIPHLKEEDINIINKNLETAGSSIKFFKS